MSTKIVKKLLAADVTDFIQDKADLAQSNAEAYADTAITNLVNGAPGVLDTLNELAAALGNDQNFAATVANNIAAVQGEVDAVEISVTAIDGRVTTAEGDIVALEGRMDTAESDIDGLQSELDATQAGAGLGIDGSYVLNGAANYISAASSLAAADNALDAAIKIVSDNLNLAEGDIVALDGRVTLAEGNIIALDGRVSTAEGDIDALEGRMTTAEGDIVALEGRMTTAEGEIDALQSDVLAIQNSVGVAGGLATLDGSGLVPSSQLPSYVDDVLEFADLGSFPVSGESGKIYVALDTNKTYRWSGSAYIYITSGAVDSVNGQTGVVSLDSDDVSEGAVNLYYTAARQSAIEAYADQAEADAIASANSYTDQAEIDANAYTDTREAAITSAYQAYADQAEADALASANSYTDAREIAITSAYQAYADQAEADAITSANAYTDAEVAILEAEDLTFVKLDGSRAMSGDLDMGGNQISDVADPVLAQDAATKAYVDGLVAGVNSAAEISFAPAGDIAATNVQAAIEEVEADYKAYADQAELDAIASANSYTDGAVAAINAAALVGVKSAKTLDATDITNQYVDLAHEIKADTLIVVFRGLVLEQGPAGGPNADYSVSTVGGVTRVTFEGDFASAGTSALVANDRLRFQYLRPAGV